MDALEKGLYIISTPIGNLGDISIRAKNTLNMVDYIICENPFHSLKLLNKLGIKKKMFSLHDYNEEILIKRIEKYQLSCSIALISDAGAPLISDPGYKLVHDYIKKNIMITTIPGPSSIVSALQLSGLPINNFKFLGFIPKSKIAVNSLLKEIENTQATSVFFISGNRLLDFLNFLLEKKINRALSICKEMTKKNELVFRGKPSKVIKYINLKSNFLKGEFVLLIAGKEKKSKTTLSITIQTQMLILLKKYSLTEVVNIVHKLTNLSKKEIYKNALMLKND